MVPPSLGCVLAEMYMDGEGPFDLAALLRYSEAQPPDKADELLGAAIAKIADPAVQVKKKQRDAKALCCHVG